MGLFLEGLRRPQIWLVASAIEQVPFNNWNFDTNVWQENLTLTIHGRKGEPYFTEKTKLTLCVDPDYHILGGLGGALDTMKLHKWGQSKTYHPFQIKHLSIVCNYAFQCELRALSWWDLRFIGWLRHSFFWPILFILGGFRASNLLKFDRPYTLTLCRILFSRPPRTCLGANWGKLAYSLCFFSMWLPSVRFLTLAKSHNVHTHSWTLSWTFLKMYNDSSIAI